MCLIKILANGLFTVFTLLSPISQCSSQLWRLEDHEVSADAGVIICVEWLRFDLSWMQPQVLYFVV